MDQFEKHKKNLEDFLQGINFIYSGDVINSVDKTYRQKLNQSSFSANLFKDIMVDVYNWSFEQMKINSKEIIIHINNFSDVYELMDSISINPKILFYSQNSNMNLKLGNHLSELEDDGHIYLPSYFNRRFKLMSFGKEVSAYFSPLIEDDIDDCHFYLIDRPIQSMVWSLQNMRYYIKDTFKNNECVIEMPIYNCDFQSYKIRVVNTQKLREDKINSILYDN